jgi:hypothetical protein
MLGYLHLSGLTPTNSLKKLNERGTPRGSEQVRKQSVLYTAEVTLHFFDIYSLDLTRAKQSNACIILSAILIANPLNGTMP